MKKLVGIGIFSVVVLGALAFLIVTNFSVIGPDRATLRFYTKWIDGQYSLADDSFMNTPELTDNLKQNIEATITSFTAGGYDPVVCSQEMPKFITPMVISETENVAEVVVRETFETLTKDIKLSLVRERALWKIAAIECGDINILDKFEEEGVILYKNNRWMFLFEKAGMPAISVFVELPDTRCGTQERCVPEFENGDRVKIVGRQINGTTIKAEIITKI